MPPAKARPNPTPTAEPPLAEGAAEIRFLASVFAELCGKARGCGAKEAAGGPARRAAAARSCSAE